MRPGDSPKGLVSRWFTFDCWCRKMSPLQISFMFNKCQMTSIISLILYCMPYWRRFWLTSGDACSWKGPKWAWNEDSNPYGVSELIIFDILETDGWFDAVHWLGGAKTSCNGVSLFKGCVPVMLRCRGLYSSPRSILIWGYWIGCNAPGKHIGCKLKPFLIDNIWNMITT